MNANQTPHVNFSHTSYNAYIFFNEGISWSSGFENFIWSIGIYSSAKCQNLWVEKLAGSNQHCGSKSWSHMCSFKECCINTDESPPKGSILCSLICMFISGLRSQHPCVKFRVYFHDRLWSPQAAWVDAWWPLLSQSGKQRRHIHDLPIMPRHMQSFALSNLCFCYSTKCNATFISTTPPMPPESI
jgi:hypothetical protein